MAKINLLPWREEERREKKRQFGSMTVLCVLLTGGLMFLVHLSVAGNIGAQEGRNSFLKSQIEVLDKEIAQIQELEKRRAELEQRMKIIQQLQQSRPLMVRLFDEMPRVLPEGIYLTEVQRKGISLTVKGRTESNPRVSAFMRNIESSQWLSMGEFGDITADKKSATPSSDFNLTVKQKGIELPAPPEAKKKPTAAAKKKAGGKS